jgi:hypothetical protein
MFILSCKICQRVCGAWVPAGASVADESRAGALSEVGRAGDSYSQGADMGQVTIILDEPTEASSSAAARAAGVPHAAWLADLIRRHVGGEPAAADAAVLVVEDNPVCREVLRSQVEFCGRRRRAGRRR